MHTLIELNTAHVANMDPRSRDFTATQSKYIHFKLVSMDLLHIRVAV